MKYKSTEKKQAEIDKHIALAKKSGKKQFVRKEKYVIWATSSINADKIFNKRVVPLIKKDAKKEFYFISEACNNLN